MIKKAVLLLLGILLLLVIFSSQAFRIKTKTEIPEQYKTALKELGSQALQNNDVPVAALVVYQDSIVGCGFNTVYRDKNLANHAEIIALNQFFVACNMSFKNINFNEVKVYSTFEPCEMCTGAFVHYGIKHIYFERPKTVVSGIKSSLKLIWIKLWQRRFDAPQLQENLFKQHPDYHKNKL